MNKQTRRRYIKPKTNIRVIREGNLRLSDRRNAKFLSEETTEKAEINSLVLSQDSKNECFNKIQPIKNEHSFNSFHKTKSNPILDLSSNTSLSSSMSVKSCFGSMGTLKVKLPVSSLQEVQNFPESFEIPRNNSSTPRSLSPNFGLDKEVLVEKHNVDEKACLLSTISRSKNDRNATNNVCNSSKRKDFAEPISDSIEEKKILKIMANGEKSPDELDQSISEANEEEISKIRNKKGRSTRVVLQGSMATGKMLMQKKIPKNPNVQITNFSALDSLAARKALLLKKTPNVSQSVRRMVPAKVIVPTKLSNTVSDEKKDVCNSCQALTLPDSVSVVAAATAAALSSQPLISSQNKLESQLATLLQKINQLEQETSFKRKELEREGKTQKIDKLESQLNHVTEERLKNLEHLQKQLLYMQTKFLEIAHGTKKMPGFDLVKSREQQTESSTQVDGTKDQCLNPLLITDIKEDKANDPSVNSDLQTMSMSLDLQESITEEKMLAEHSGCEMIVDPKLLNDEKNFQSEYFNTNNSGKLILNSKSSSQFPKNISVPFLEKKPKVTNPKNPSFAAKTRPNSTNSKSKENSQPKSSLVKESLKSFPQKKSHSTRTKVANQRTNKDVRLKTSKDKPNPKEPKNMSVLQEPPPVDAANCRYSALKDFVSGRYSQEPYMFEDLERFPRSDSEKIINTSYTIQNPIPEMELNEDVNFEVPLNRPRFYGEAPLDKYLLHSPDKSSLFTRDKIYSDLQQALPSAELLAGQEILRKAQNSRKQLETNLRMVERDVEKDAVYGLVDNLCEDVNPGSHHFQLRRKVDRCIAKVQKDIQNELLLEEDPLYSSQEKSKDKKAPSYANVQKGPYNKFSSKKLPINKPHKDRGCNDVKQSFGKEDENRMLRKPWPQFENDVKVRSTRGSDSVKAMQVQTMKAQMSPKGKKKASESKALSQQIKAVNFDENKYFFVSSENGNSLKLQKGHLGFMAVALRQPRMDSGLKVPVSIHVGDSCTLAPEDQPKLVPASNIMLCNIPVCNEDNSSKKKPKLVKQTLPSVVIEAQEEPSEPGKNLGSTCKVPSPKEKTNSVPKNSVEDNSDENVQVCWESSEFIAEENQEENLIVLSGRSNCHVTGPKGFKANSQIVKNTNAGDILDCLPPKNLVPWVSFVPDVDQSQQSLETSYLQGQALQWIEQEIVSHPKLPFSSSFVYEEVIDDHPNYVSNPENEAATPRGLQGDADSSVRIDKDLISQLVEELLLDKVSNMIKEAFIENSEDQQEFGQVESDAPPSKEECPSEPIISFPQTPELTPSMSEEEILVSEKENHFLPQTPSVSPPFVSERNSAMIKNSSPKEASGFTFKGSLLHEVLNQELLKLKEEKGEGQKEEEEGGEGVYCETPQQTPSLTSILNDSPLTPASSLSPQAEPEEEEDQWMTIETPLPSLFSPETVEEIGEVRKSQSQLNEDKEEIISLIENQSPLPPPAVDGMKLNEIPEKRSESKESSEGTSSVSMTASESEATFESLSVGQWLLSKSEGQVADFRLPEKMYRQVLNDASTASTLRDTEDLIQDETTELTFSDGEVVHRNRVPPEKDPLLELMTQMRNPLPLANGILIQTQETDQSEIGRSLGELCFLEDQPDRFVSNRPDRTSTGFSSKGSASKVAQDVTPNSNQEDVTPNSNQEDVTPYSNQEDDRSVFDKETCPPQKGATVIKVGQHATVPSAVKSVSPKTGPLNVGGRPSEMDVVSISDADQIPFLQKSVHFNETHFSSLDSNLNKDCSSDLVLEMEKLNARLSNEEIIAKQHRQMAVKIPQPNNFFDDDDDDDDDDDIEEIYIIETK